MNRHGSSKLAIGLGLILLLGPESSLALAAYRKEPNSPAKTGSLRSNLPIRKPGISYALQQPSTTTGQTSTLLPDGRWLLIGGMGADGPSDTIEIANLNNGKKSAAKHALQVARAWHTATLLPDGTVLIVGGVDAKGGPIGTAELFNPKSEAIETIKSNLTARAHHSATLLTDGRVFFAGGSSATGELLSDTELWNQRTRTTSRSSAMATSRLGHQATLLPDGNVLLWGGKTNDGIELTSGEVYDVESQNLSARNLPDQENTSAPFVEASLPRDGSGDVSVDALIALRFSRPLRVETVTDETFSLSGPQGKVSTRVVAAERGMLAFVSPVEKLSAGSTYALSISNAMANDGQPLSPTAMTFTTAADSKANRAQDLDDGESWVPDASNLRGNWRSNRPKASWEDLPALQAARGVTALAGRTLTLNGAPLANVNLEIDGTAANTDRTGRFLLSSISAGHHVMKIDGRPASRPSKVYGTFKVGVDIREGETNVLPFTIWMPKLDMAHATDIPSPTTTEVVVTNPQIPGLELHLPPGTVIRDMDGKIVKQVSLTPVPTDRPPFPLPPGVDVPIFFTAQPGGAQVIPPRARVIYPNFTQDPPGSRITFWNYDPTERGWYIYGKGTVTRDGRQVIPDPGVVVYEFTGIMIGSSGGPPRKGPKPGGNSKAGDPVDTGTGLFVYQKTDLALPDTLPLVLNRTYRPGDNVSRAFGIGTSHEFEVFLWTQIVGQYQNLDLVLSDGGRVHYTRTSTCQANNNPCTSFTDAVFESANTPSSFYKSKITWNGTGWDLKFNDGTVFAFGDVAPLKSIRDRFGNTITISRDNANSLGAPTGNITKLTSSNGRWIQFTYDGFNRVTQAKDNGGRTVSYAYDGGGRLSQVTDVGGGVTAYTYDANNQMVTIRDPRGIVYLTNQYDSNGRVTKQTQADGSTYLFAYTVDGNDNVTQTDVTNPRGNIHRVTFNSDGYKLSETFALGKPEQETLTYSLQASTNLVLSATDQLSRQTAYAYDSFGNITDITRLAGTPQAVNVHYTYEPTFNQVASTTDGLTHTYSFGYTNGTLTSVTDPLNNQTVATYNSAGQPLVVTDALNHAIHFSYNAGDLVTITDPLNRSVNRTIDAVGRVIAMTDALGRRGQVSYDAFNQPSTTTDPLGGLTGVNHDGNGNVTSVADTGGGGIAYTFDNMDRIVSRTDALQHSSTYQYDPSGNLSRITDRKGQATNYSYDALGRLTQITYADASTINYTYDAGNRLRQITDSLSGTITRDYDNLNRLTQVTCSQGQVNYTYDAAGRRTSMTVLGQPTVNYTYDDANHVTQITQGTATVSFGYDAAGRRTSLTLPGGVQVEYSYDDASELTGINYKLGTTVLGDLTYAFDAAGHVTSIGGSYARTGLPAAFTSATYNAAHQMVTRGNQTLSYDANGNLTNDGVNTYTWDARNQLVAIGGSVTASFQYDANGRRISKTVGGQTAGYLYDGVNVVQELAGASPTANLLTGGVDHVFARTDAAGTKSFLPGGTGSTLALANDNGTIETEYTYDPFGNSSSNGTASNNSTQYTGRENDGSGLYYYRNRYYSPTLQRFISEDPIGLAGGPNLYAYVGNNPTSRVDPFGTDWLIDILGPLAHVSAGFGDTISFGLTKKIRDLTPARKAIDYDSDYYAGGQVLGVAHQVVTVVATAGGALELEEVGELGEAAEEGDVVIGKLKDLESLEDGERTLNLPDQGSPQANWQQNSGQLREAMREGNPIRDASVDPATGALRDNTGFLRAERNLLDNHGWQYNPSTGSWHPPGGP